MAVRAVRHLSVSVDSRPVRVIPFVVLLVGAGCAGSDNLFGPSCTDRTVATTAAPTTTTLTSPALECSGGSTGKRVPSERQ